MTKRFLVLACAALAACSHTAMQAARQDARLLEEIARASIAEIAAGNMAVTKAEAPALKEFGERLVDDRSSVLKAASGLAATRGTSVPATPGARHEPALKQLQSLSGAAFDRAFLEYMAKHNEETLRLLEQASAQTGDPQLRSYAQKAIAHFEQRLATAQRMAF